MCDQQACPLEPFALMKQPAVDESMQPSVPPWKNQWRAQIRTPQNRRIKCDVAPLNTAPEIYFFKNSFNYPTLTNSNVITFPQYNIWRSIPEAMTSVNEVKTSFTTISNKSSIHTDLATSSNMSAGMRILLHMNGFVVSIKVANATNWWYRERPWNYIAFINDGYRDWF